MQQFLKDLLEEIDTIDLGDGEIQPDKEVAEGEVVVGELPDNLKQFFGVFAQLHKDLSASCKAVHGRFEAILAKDRTTANPEDVAFVQQHLIEHGRIMIVNSIFWHAVKETFPELVEGDPSIGIRKDWKVVTFDNGPRFELISMLR